MSPFPPGLAVPGPDPLGLGTLAAAPPAVAEAELLALLRSRYGRTGPIARLPGERDANYLVEDPAGGRAVLKLFNGAEPAAARALQRAVLLHLAGRPMPLAVPRLIPTRAGGTGCAIAGADGPVDAMLVSFVPGEPWSARPSGAGLRGAVGEAAARLRRALAGFDPPAARRSLPWDLMGLGRLAPVAAALPAGPRRAWLSAFVARFEAELRPAAAALPAGAIHNDLNPSNVLLHPGQDRVCGLIDFGDLLHGPLIADLAVACSYDLAAADPAEAVADVAAGYARVVPLALREAGILFDLVLARLVLRVLVYAWRAGRGAGAEPYLARHAAPAHAALDAVMALPPGHGRAGVLARLRRDDLLAPEARP